MVERVRDPIFFADEGDPRFNYSLYYFLIRKKYGKVYRKALRKKYNRKRRKKLKVLFSKGYYFFRDFYYKNKEEQKKMTVVKRVKSNKKLYRGKRYRYNKYNKKIKKPKVKFTTRMLVSYFRVVKLIRFSRLLKRTNNFRYYFLGRKFIRNFFSARFLGAFLKCGLKGKILKLLVMLKRKLLSLFLDRQIVNGIIFVAFGRLFNFWYLVKKYRGRRSYFLPVVTSKRSVHLRLVFSLLKRCFKMQGNARGSLSFSNKVASEFISIFFGYKSSLITQFFGIKENIFNSYQENRRMYKIKKFKKKIRW